MSENKNTVTTLAVKDVLEQLKVDTTKLKLDEFTPLPKRAKMMLETPNGYEPVVSIVKKRDVAVTLKFEGLDKPLVCAANHILYDYDRASRVKAHVVTSGMRLVCGNSYLVVETVSVSNEPTEFFDFELDGTQKLYKTADGLLHHNTTNVLKVLNDTNLKRDVDWVYFKGKMTAASFYLRLFQNKDAIMVLDDIDGLFSDDDTLMLLKGALDSGKVREISWDTKSATIKNLPEDDEHFKDNPDHAPAKFTYNGRIIILTNAPKEEVLKDTAIKSRGIAIDINPSNEDVFENLRIISDDVNGDNTSHITHDERVVIIDQLEKYCKESGALFQYRMFINALSIFADEGTNGLNEMLPYITA